MKRINYFVAVAAALAIGFTSCSKDSDPAPAQDIAKEYKDAELTVTNAGETVPGGTMKIDAVDNTNATVTLTSIVNGQPSFEMPVTVVAATTGYAFEGKKDIDGMKVAVKGTVVEGKASADVTVEITTMDILGAWAFSQDFYGEGAGIVFEIKTKTGKLVDYSQDKPVSTSAEEYSKGFEFMGGMMLGGALENFSFNFQSNGYVGIKGKSNFSPEGKQDVDMPKLARYYYNPTTKTLVFDAPLGGLLSKATDTPSLGGTMQVPFRCTLGEGKLKAVLDDAFVGALLQLIPTGMDIDTILKMLDGAIPENMQDILPWIKGNIKTIFVALTDENFESFALGGRLVPVEAEK